MTTNVTLQSTQSITADVAIRLGKAYKKLVHMGANAAGMGMIGATNGIRLLEDDFYREGSWDYKIEVVTNAVPSALDRVLNGLGRERWECFWIRESKEGLMLLLKRRNGSILREVIKLRGP